MKRILLITSLLALLPGCTSVRVQPVDAGLGFRNVCIEENARTTVEDFLPVVRDGFRRNGIPTRVVAKPAPKECEFVLTYVAYKEYDGFAPYLDHAELKVEKDGKVVALAVYHLIGGGGMSLMKWESTKTKMDPVVDRLLANVRR